MVEFDCDDGCYVPYEAEKLDVGKRKPKPLDLRIGRRIQVRRKTLGISQGALGESIGVTFQQIQKYEKGANRIGASQLQAIASALEVPVSFFYDEGFAAGVDQATTDGKRVNSPLDFLNDAEAKELNGAFA